MKSLLIVVIALSTVGSILAQGSLTPPGAPGAMMKTLDQVEARTPISSPGTTISESGSYYLTGNLYTTESQQGVRVSADDVTIDLNGFTIDGSAASSGNGVYVNTGVNNAQVLNGTIKNNVGNGIYAANATNCVFRNLVIVDNSRATSTYDGISGGIGTVVENCRCEGNGDAGISAKDGSRIVNNTVARNGRTGLDINGAGSFVDGNIVKENGTNYKFDDGNQLNLLLCEIPESIDWPASVKLAGSLESTGHGVVITASGVTLDLMGFTLSGDRGSSDYGVFLDGATDSAIRNVVVRNGIVRNFDYGVRAEYTQDSRFECLITATNINHGIILYGTTGPCDGNAIANCTISGNGSCGIYLNGYLGQCDGNAIANCTINGNSGYGICLSGYGGRCDGNSLANCTISGNTFYGIYLNGYLGLCNGNSLADCTVSGNLSSGIFLRGLSGQCDGNIIADCTIRRNVDNGIYMIYADGNRVEGNHITGQTGGTTTYGIFCNTTARNLIFRNTCVGQTNNFLMSANDTYGPIITGSGALANTGDASHPLANFSR